jgi:hypothetical protein
MPVIAVAQVALLRFVTSEVFCIYMIRGAAPPGDTAL